MRYDDEVYQRIAYLRGYIDGLADNENPDLVKMNEKEHEIDALVWVVESEDDEIESEEKWN